MSPITNLRIGVVGPCAAGKSTLVASLIERGHIAKHIAQEHSYVKNMWRRISNPDILIYLDVSYKKSCLRRKMDWTEKEYQEQVHRLRDARSHADFYLDTDNLTISEVLEQVVAFIDNHFVLGQSP